MLDEDLFFVLKIVAIYENQYLDLLKLDNTIHLMYDGRFRLIQRLQETILFDVFNWTNICLYTWECS